MNGANYTRADRGLSSKEFEVALAATRYADRLSLRIKWLSTSVETFNEIRRPNPRHVEFDYFPYGG